MVVLAALIAAPVCSAAERLQILEDITTMSESLKELNEKFSRLTEMIDKMEHLDNTASEQFSELNKNFAEAIIVIDQWDDVIGEIKDLAIIFLLFGIIVLLLVALVIIIYLMDKRKNKKRKNKS